MQEDVRLFMKKQMAKYYLGLTHYFFSRPPVFRCDCHSISCGFFFFFGLHVLFGGSQTGGFTGNSNLKVLLGS